MDAPSRRLCYHYRKSLHVQKIQIALRVWRGVLSKNGHCFWGEMTMLRRFIALSAVAMLAAACGRSPQVSGTKSITGPDYQGHKYYFGWGVNGNGVGEMDNEVKYDVLHTSNIFSKAQGGSYISKTLIGEDEVNARSIKQGWRTLTDEMQANDMYLQYSSGHGYEGGLAAGVDYGNIIDATLAMPAQEKVIFTMACYSGGLVDAFNDAKDRWSDYKNQNKTLFVMASSKAYEESSTGPGTDVDEPNGPDGSAGSAYGHAVWKALIGYADGAVDGQKDGKMTLDEVIKYVVQDTEQEGGHTPVYTGTYDPKLVISLTPTYAEALQIVGDTAPGRAELAKLVDDGIVK